MEKGKPKKDLEDKIKELENKLNQFKVKNTPPRPKPDWMKAEDQPFKMEHDVEIGENVFDTIKEIDNAKKAAIPRAGAIPTTENGSVLEEDNVEPVRIPDESIHEFTNLEECECECHPKKQDCIDCYDHPCHLDAKRKEVKKEEYDEQKIAELIEADKNKKKSWWKR